MNIQLIIAAVLTFLAFLVHTFVGDREVRLIEPKEDGKMGVVKLEKWTMARCGWHWISFDLLFASVGLGLIQFTDQFENEDLLLKILAFYFLGYGVVWLITILISEPFPGRFLKLGQWLLLWCISGLIWWGMG